jgi:serine/threonine protein kinase
MAPGTSAIAMTHEEVAPQAREDAPRAWLGRVVGGTYRLVRWIGAGGSGNVFEAEHLRLGKSFAVKVLRVEAVCSERGVKRFHQEARAIAKTKGEYVVSIVDSGELEDGTPYLVMEYLDGEELRSLLRREGALPVGRALHIVRDACLGLVQVHAAGLVHRDLKPENLFITVRAQGEDWCKLLDFGVVKMETSQATAHGSIIGTVRYMAPEQLADNARVNAATDVYALGLVLYECLAGKPAHPGASVQELMYRVMNVEPASLAELRPELPSGLVSLVERCIAKRPEARPQSARELLGLLQAHACVQTDDAQTTLAETRLRASTSPRPRGISTRVLAISTLLAFVSGVAAAALPRSRSASQAKTEKTRATPIAQSPSRPSVASPSLPPPHPSALSATSASAAASVANPLRRAEPIAAAAAPVSSAATRRGSVAPLSSTAPRQLSVARFDQVNPYGE